MTVHALMPVFNRLEMTRTMLECLRQQVLDEPLRITVVDDGSTDGTDEFLKSQGDVTTLKGDGNLWWGGGIDLGLRHLFGIAAADDWVLFVNNDTELHSDFVQQLLYAARRLAPAAVGSVIRDVRPPHRLLSIGPRIDAWGLGVQDVLSAKVGDVSSDEEVTRVDALSGRGVLFPVAALRAVQGMHPWWVPHYLADYELAVRVQAAGWGLYVCNAAAVYSSEEFGVHYRGRNIKERFFSVRSPTYLPAVLRFWWEASSGWQRLTLPFRILAAAVSPR